METEASSIRMYANFLVVGLFQTEGTTREILRTGQKRDVLDQLVATRMERQQILHRADPPDVLVQLDEYAVRRKVGDREVRRQQLQHLLDLMDQPHIDIVIVPDGAPIFPATSFTLLSFPDGRPDIGYVESVDGHGRIIEPGPQVAKLAVYFERIGSNALPVTDTEKLIRALLENL